MRRFLLFATLVLVTACVVDDLGNRCGYFEALNDGESRWCPQDDAPDRCDEIATALAGWNHPCALMADEEEKAAEFSQELGCDEAVAVSGGLDACVAAIDEGSCFTDTGLPADCQGIVMLAN